MISKFFIERPIFASVIAIVLVISGLVTLRTLPIAQYPDITLMMFVLITIVPALGCILQAIPMHKYEITDAKLVEIRTENETRREAARAEEAQAAVADAPENGTATTDGVYDETTENLTTDETAPETAATPSPDNDADNATDDGTDSDGTDNADGDGMDSDGEENKDE